ncbi:MAG: EAL domain-containing protein [Actinomycetota bacterium]|nr:EAL domain-containing protein [Actinomycetota bacterium]
MSASSTGTPVVEPPRPTLRSVLPFVAIFSLGLATVFLPPHNRGWSTESLLMVALTPLWLGLLVIGLRRRERTWVDAAPVFLSFVQLMLARDLTGGTASSLGPLIALPLLWLALTGTRRELGVASGLTAVVFVAPIYLVGPPDYLASDWRTAVAWTLFGTFVATTILRLVQRLAEETSKERAAKAELAGVMRGATLSSMITTDVGGTIRSFGVGAEELLGYRAEEMVGRQSPGLFHDPDEVAEVARELGVAPGFGVFAELARRGEPTRVWTYVRADGGRIYVRLAVTELRDADELLTGYLGVAIDTTASVESERALAISDGRWRVLMDNLADTTVVVLDEDLRLRVVSGRGAMRQQLHDKVGSLLSDFANAENMAIWRPLVAAAFAGREGSSDLTATQTGAEHVVVVTPLPADEDGPRVLILARDVSIERSRERALMRAKERAERLFSDAPHGVALLTPSGMVVQANDAMESMAGGTPGGLVGTSLASLGAPDDDRLRRHLDAAMDAGPVEMEWTMCGGGRGDVHVILSSRRLPGSDEGDDLVLVNVVNDSERQAHQQELAHLANHDPLTGLANRRRLDELLARHLERCDREGPRGALLLLDLDNFKEVNDTLGHGAGDELLVSAARLLTGSLRHTDLVARLGGDEFAVLLPEADASAAAAVAAAIVNRIRQHTAPLEGARRRVTASVGVVTFEAASHHSMDVLALADMTMYDAKDAGRNGYACLDVGVSRRPRTAARLEWKGRIEKALENDGFSLRLQPILDLSTDRVTSAEVLLRLNDTEQTVLPEQFLGIAEHAGLSPSIDMWVLRHSIGLLHDIRQRFPDFQLAVNLSGHSIGHPEVERTIVDSLARRGVDPAALILEITETAALTDVIQAREFVERVGALGCEFALDDFGSGFGSFFYLKHLAFDVIKIDGGFVADSHRSPIDRSIMRSIVGIARELGMKTVAEFVADEDILGVVREEGVDFAQGYLIGRPVRPEAFLEQLISQDHRVLEP